MRDFVLFLIIDIVLGAAAARGADTSKFVGGLYIQSNAAQANEVFHYGRRKDGTLSLIGTHLTGGKGSGTYKPLTGQDPAPNAFEGAGSVILSPDRKLVFTTNGGDNSVSSFRVDSNGHLLLIECKPTGEVVEGGSGTAKSLAYSDKHRTLYVLHAFGPNHLRIYDVEDGKLTLRPQRRSVDTPTKAGRVSTQAVLTPDQRFLVVNVLFDAQPAMNPDGTPKLVVTNATDKDGLVVFPVEGDGALGEPMFEDAGGAGPFYIQFIHGSRDTFLNGHAVSDGVSIGRIDSRGRVAHDPVVRIDASAGAPSELCWLALSSDNRMVFATNFGFSNVSSYFLRGGKLFLAKDPACPAVPGDGKFRAVNNLVSSGPSDSWLSPDDKTFYQLYPNASALVAYRVNADASLDEIQRTTIPYTSPQGMTGY
ncbi:Lactonase, 7-bladed beta-propeller [Phycisphaerae bacterium RAS2]|nr:Lactonase, 7-bladed beta-propeller [Phycisphaerae bacterium RAS2]